MLSEKKILFLGGDSRQLEMIELAIQANAEVSLMGFDNLNSSLTGSMQKILSEDSFKNIDILVLPVMGTDNEGKLSTIFSTKKLMLDQQLIDVLPSHCSIFVGVANVLLKELCVNRKLYELMHRDDVAIFNSIPTVEGALMMAIQHTNFTLHGSEAIVLGLGRVGMSLARTLNVIGVRVKVGVRSSADKARAFEMGLSPFDIGCLASEVKDTNILFNTVPAKVVGEDALKNMLHDSLIIDLASKPGGVDFDYAEKRGIKAILSPGLPGIVAPKTAGKILFDTIIRILKENGDIE